MNVNPRKLNVCGFALPAALPPLDRIAAELQQPGFVPMQFERELLEPRSHLLPEAARFGLVLEAHDQIVGVAHDDHVALGFAPPPLLRPKVEDVVQVDVGQQRRDHRALRRPPFHWRAIARLPGPRPRATWPPAG